MALLFASGWSFFRQCHGKGINRESTFSARSRTEPRANVTRLRLCSREGFSHRQNGLRKALRNERTTPDDADVALEKDGAQRSTSNAKQASKLDER